MKIYEYVGGLLHTKSLTIDGEITLIGSANIDRRSFELNFENNILFVDQRADRRHARAAGELHRRARDRVDAADVAALDAPAAHLEQRHRDARPGALRDLCRTPTPVPFRAHVDGYEQGGNKG